MLYVPSVRAVLVCGRARTCMRFMPSDVMRRRRAAFCGLSLHVSVLCVRSHRFSIAWLFYWSHDGNLCYQLASQHDHRGARTCMKNIPALITCTSHTSQLFAEVAKLIHAAGCEQSPLAAHALVKIAAWPHAPVFWAPSAADQMSADVDVERAAGASRWSVRPLSRAQASKARARDAQRLGTGRAARSSSADEAREF